MSQFLNSVKARLTGRERPIVEPLRVELLTGPIGSSPSPFSQLIKEYSIRVEWERSVFCSPEKLPVIIENVIRELREAIYGDLKDRIIRLERAILEHNLNTAQMEIRDITREIFG